MSMNADDMAALSGMYNNAGRLQKEDVQNRYKLGKGQIKANLKIAEMESRDKRAGIEAERDMNRERIAQAAAEMQQIGIPRVEIERFTAEKNAELAQAELGLKRDIFLAETGHARDQLQLDREQMEKVGIPQVEINRYVAEKQADIAQQEQVLKREQFVKEFGLSEAAVTGLYQGQPTLAQQELTQKAQQFGMSLEQAQSQFEQTFGEGQRQFNQTQAQQAAQFEQTFGEGQRQFDVGASGYMTAARPLTDAEQQRYSLLKGIEAATPQNLSSTNRQELAQFDAILSGAVGGGQQATLARQTFEQTQVEQDRQYALDVARFGADEAERRRQYALSVGQFGAQLASTPDTYFQARRFQGVDVPRLLGGAGAASAGPAGGPTPGIATMGAYLGGSDPYATPYGGAAAGGTPQAAGGSAAAPGAAVPGAAVPGVLGMPGTTEDDRARQLAAIAKASPPSPYDGLNDQDASTLKLMESIYKRGGQGIAGGEYERLAASGRLGFLQSAGKLLGYDPNELQSQYQAYRPAQGAAGLAG